MTKKDLKNITEFIKMHINCVEIYTGSDETIIKMNHYREMKGSLDYLYAYERKLNQEEWNYLSDIIDGWYLRNEKIKINIPK